jgi:Bacterial SH3 domain
LRPGAAMPGQRHLLVWGISILLLGLAAVWAWPLLQPSPAQPLATAAAVVPTITRIPTRTPIFPTNTPQPTRTATPIPELGKGKTAIVTTAGLRSRLEPTTDSRVVITFREGDRVTILDGPRDADGYIWWQIEGNAGSGWSAERSAEGVQWLRVER